MVDESSSISLYRLVGTSRRNELVGIKFRVYDLIMKREKVYMPKT